MTASPTWIPENWLEHEGHQPNRARVYTVPCWMSPFLFQSHVFPTLKDLSFLMSGLPIPAAVTMFVLLLCSWW